MSRLNYLLRRNIRHFDEQEIISEATVDLTDAQKNVLKPLIKGIKELSANNKNVLELVKSLEKALGLRRGKGL